MDIWLIQHGERCGPFSPYDIEGRIARDEVRPDQPAWHDGMPAWATLEDMPQFATAFQRVATPKPSPATPTPPPTPTQPLLLRRFFARWFDFHLIHLAWWAALAAANQDLTAIYQNGWLALAPLIPWIFLETFLLQRFGTTPGKALLALRITFPGGTTLSAQQALLRTLRVLTLGLGLGLPFLTIICQSISFWLTRRYGASLWDLAPGHRPTGRPLAVLRVILFSALFLLVLQALGTILVPTIVAVHGDQFPWLRDALQQPN